MPELIALSEQLAVLVLGDITGETGHKRRSRKWSARRSVFYLRPFVIRMDMRAYHKRDLVESASAARIFLLTTEIRACYQGAIVEHLARDAGCQRGAC